MSYRELNKKEMKELYNNLRGFYDNNEKYPQIIKLVNKYFENPSVILVSVSSEYNDEYYDNRVSSISVYDSKEVEIPLSRETRQAFNNDVANADFSLGRSDDEDNEAMEDIVIYVNKSLPKIYIEDKE